MTNEKTIELSLKEVRYRGIYLGDQQYIIDMLDYCYGHEREDGVRVPARAYEVVSFDENIEIAVAREINERTLIERIAIAMDNDREIRETFRWLAKNKPEAFGK